MKREKGLFVSKHDDKHNSSPENFLAFVFGHRKHVESVTTDECVSSTTDPNGMTKKKKRKVPLIEFIRNDRKTSLSPLTLIHRLFSLHVHKHTIPAYPP